MLFEQHFTVLLRQVMLLLLALLGCLQLCGQNPQWVWHNYSIEDGLSSNEVHYCLQTPDGYMWFATDNGLSRFDGYEFKNYGSREGLEDPVILNLQLDPEGNLWMATLSGRLFYLEDERIHSFVGNDTIQALREQYPFKYRGSGFLIDSTGHLFLPLDYLGILEFDQDNQLTLHQGHQGEFHSNLVKQIHNTWMTTLLFLPDSLRDLVQDNYWHTGYSPPIELESDSTYSINNLPVKPSGDGITAMVELSGGQTYLMTYYDFFEIRNGQVIWNAKRPSGAVGKRIHEMTDGSLLIGDLFTKGLHHYSDLEAWKKEVGEVYLPGLSVTHIFHDQQNNLWVSTLENGVFVRNPEDWQLFDQKVGLSADHVTCLSIQDEDNVFLGLLNGEVYQLINKEVVPLPSPEKGGLIFDMVYDPSNEELWVSSRRYLWYREGKVWNNMWKLNPGREIQGVKKLYLNPRSGILWSSRTRGFDVLHTDKKMFLFISGYDYNTRTQVIREALNGTVWVGNINGLFVLTQNATQRPVYSYPALENRVEDLDELSDGTLVVGSKGEGILLLKDSLFRQFTRKDGLIADMVENVYVDGRDNIWVGTLNGLNKISGFSWADKNAVSIRTLRTEHGLPSNEINDVESWKDQIWVATGKGLVHFTDNIEIDTTSLPPRVIRFSVNNRDLDTQQKAVFSHADNNITVQFLTINFQQQGQIPYRYRLLPTTDQWEEAQAREINFSALEPGQYTFEVQSQNEDGIWSATTPYAFQILPPWWETWWARTIGGLIIAGLGLAFYKSRTRQLKKEIDLQKRMAETERQALRAQMNPHFIFNSLNAIQGYIAVGDKASANRYLSRFAKLIRGALLHSRSQKIPLEDDLQQLKTYMELEQSRFQGSFEFHIQLDEKIDPYLIEVPPMLIQPFVENAIVHGLAGEEQRGRIDILYQWKEEGLGVIIRDNGVGIETSKRQKTAIGSTHKSVGLSVTRRRLEMLSQDKQLADVSVREIKDAQGRVLGTQAELLIPLTGNPKGIS